MCENESARPMCGDMSGGLFVCYTRMRAAQMHRVLDTGDYASPRRRRRSSDSRRVPSAVEEQILYQQPPLVGGLVDAGEGRFELLVALAGLLQQGEQAGLGGFGQGPDLGVKFGQSSKEGLIGHSFPPAAPVRSRSETAPILAPLTVHSSKPAARKSIANSNKNACLRISDVDRLKGQQRASTMAAFGRAARTCLAYLVSPLAKGG